MPLHRTIRVTKSFTFEMAHALLGYDGDCRNIHGHSYKLHVTLRGQPLHQPGHPNDGMVMDFKHLKKLVKTIVLDIYDHALVLNEATPATVVAELAKHYEKLVTLPFQPTCENLVLEFVGKIQGGLPESVELYEVELFETATSKAVWCAGDKD
ncbi:MAG: 6-carboxytetrahydropterin synthase [Saprospiraceae bacterium]|nr:6-carboxytetrahydropterin synthase [Saprospiraceae bacterium]